MRLWPRTEAHMDLLTTKLAIPTRLLPMLLPRREAERPIEPSGLTHLTYAHGR